MSIYLVFKILASRKKFTGYVCITGGEPTIYSDLPEFIRLLYNDGFKIKLDTNGLNPDILEKCLPYLDYIAMDIKTSFKKYPLLEKSTKFRETLNSLKINMLNEESIKSIKSKISLNSSDRKLSKISKFSLKDRIYFYRNRLLYSIGMVMTSGIDYEFRTTLVPRLVDEEDILDIGSYIAGCKRYVLQQYFPERAYKKKIYPSQYEKRILDSFKEKLKLFKIREIIIKNV